MRLSRLLRSRSSAGVVDAAAVALTGFVTVLLATRVGGTGVVGEVSLASTVVLIGAGLFRVFVGMPVLARSESVDPRYGALASLSLTVGPAAGAVVVGLVLGAALESVIVLTTFLWLAAALGLEAVRFGCMALGRYGRLLALDVIALVVATGLMLLATSTPTLILSLTAGLAAACAVGLAQLGLSGTPSPLSALGFWRRELSSHAWPLVADSVVYTVTTQGLLWIVAVRASVEQVGELRLAMLFAFPFSILMAGLANRTLQRLGGYGVVERSASARRMGGAIAALSAVMVVTGALLAPLVIDFAAERGTTIPLPAVLLVLANAALLFLGLPFFSLGVVEGLTVRIAAVRAASGIAAASLVAFTFMGLGANGAALASALSSGGLLVGVLWITRDVVLRRV